MKGTYIAPMTELTFVTLREQLFASSYIPVEPGGGGGFDNKPENDWGDIWSNEEEPSQRYKVR